MNRFFFLTIFIFYTCIGSSQLFDIDHLVDIDVDFIRVKNGDFDNDGDQDLLSLTSQKLVWYENLDGQGTFGPAIEIDNGMGQSFNQLVVDLDQDGWQDLLISYFDLDIIAYYHNQGNGSFVNFVTLASGLNKVAGIAAGDLDGDGDLDLALGVSNNSGFYWIEHLNGNGSFGPLQSIGNTLSQARNQSLGDIDGDGDLDILTNSSGSTIMSWFENTNGLGNFSVQHVIDNSGEFYENYFQLADIDGDGDLDNVSNKVNEILWRENLDGQGNFGSKQVIFSYSDVTPDLASLYAVDVDNDGDLDVTYDSGWDFGKVYHINTNGQGTFGPAQSIDPPEGGSSSNNLPVDIDGDGDMDLINSSFNNVTNIVDLYWYENLTILNVSDVEALGIKIYPNPVKEVLVIESAIVLEKVTLYTLLGDKVLEVTKDFEQIPMSQLPSGILLVELNSEKGILVEKVVKE
ncbi:MAG: T9SS type A sorting domain-containing protein [Flavobacteriaceae bacterium]